MKEHISQKLQEAVESKKRLLGMEGHIFQMSSLIVDSFRKGGKVVLFGNGGSAADAQHIAAEFVCLLDKSKERPSMHATALTTNPSIVTAVSNDFGYEHLFSRQVEGIVNENDVVIGISTSGNSLNIINGLMAAKRKGAKTIGFSGESQSRMDDIGLDFVFRAPSTDCNRIQEMHITVGHILCGAVEKEMHSL